MVGGFYGMLLLSAKCPRPPGRRENTVWKTIWRTIQRTNNTFWSNGWISTDFPKDQSRIHQVGKNVKPGIFHAYEFVGGENLERRYSDSGSGRFGKVVCIRYSSSKNQRERSIENIKRWRIHIPVADGTAKLSGRDFEFREPTLRRRKFQQRTSWWTGRVSTDRIYRWRWSRADLWSIQGDFICRHHNETRVQLNVPKEETFPIPLKYIGVTRSTHTDLDVLQEKRVDDYWNVYSNRSLSDAWRGFTKLTFLTGKTFKGICVVRERRLTKIQATTRPDHVWPQIWTKIGKAAQNREKREWAKEKPKLDNARRLRGMYFIDPDDGK